MAANYLKCPVLLQEPHAHAACSSNLSFQQLLSSPKIPSLNGIRAIAAISVVLYHLGVSPIPGNYGVVAFFVLSGFLITNRLLHEAKKTGTVRLKAFYWRRAVRLLPAFYVFAAVYLCSRLLAHASIDWLQLLASVTYLGDYYMALQRPLHPVMTHTWSLAVEEQFYLVWPFLFLAFQNRLQWLWKATLLAVTLIAIYRGLLSLAGVSGDYLYYAFETRLDSLLLGCFAALAIHTGKRFRVLIFSPLVGAFALASIALLRYLNIALRGLPFDFNAVVINALLPVLCIALILNCIWFAEHPAYRWLNCPAMDWLGVLSYSIYLYHPLTIKVVGDLPTLARVLAALIGSILVAFLSYMWIEKPFLKLKEARPTFRPVARTVTTLRAPKQPTVQSPKVEFRTAA